MLNGSLDNHQINEIINKLKNNEILILPTDTIYGLSMIVKNNEPDRLNSLKHANLNKPVISLIANFDSIKNDVEADKQAIEILEKSLYPTTVIFKLKNSDQTVAMRICKRKDLQQIILKTGPIYSTSVNDSGKAPLNDYQDLVDFLNNKDNVYYVGPLNEQPSKIYNSITKKWVR